MRRYFSLPTLNTTLFVFTLIVFCSWVLFYSGLPEAIVTVATFALSALFFAIPKIRTEFLTNHLTPFVLGALSLFFGFLTFNQIPITSLVPPPNSTLVPVPTLTPDLTATTSYELTRIWAEVALTPTATFTPTPNLTATTSYQLTHIWAEVALTPAATFTPTGNITRTFEASLTQAWLNYESPIVDITSTFETALTQAWLAATPDATVIFETALTRAWELQISASATPSPK